MRTEMSMKNGRENKQSIQWISVLGAYLVMIAMLKWPESAKKAAQTAMIQWYYSVAPVLFPFMMLMPLITGEAALQIYERLLGGFMRKVFDLPGAAAPAVIIALAAGSPASASAAGKVASHSGMNKGQLMRVAGCMCGLSPAFIISAVGSGFLGNISDGMLLFKVQVITQLTMLATSRLIKNEAELPFVNEEEKNGTAGAVISVLSVAGYMVIFGVLADVVRNFTGSEAGNKIICILEITSGAAHVASTAIEYRVKMIILAAICSFGGVSICAQNMKILAKYGISAGEYIPWRIVSGVISACIMAVMIRCQDLSTPVFQFDWMKFASIAVFFLAIPAVFCLKKHIS